MTKNQLTRLLGIEALMRRNSKSKVFTTMLDIICDYLIITKEASGGLGVSFPKITSSSIRITHSSNDNEPKSYKPNPPPGLPARPMTSGGVPKVAKTQQNFFKPPGPVNDYVPSFNGLVADSSSDLNRSTTKTSQPSTKVYEDHRLDGRQDSKKSTILLNQSSVDDFAQDESVPINNN